MRVAYFCLGVVSGLLVSVGCDAITLKGEKVFRSAPVSQPADEGVETQVVEPVGAKEEEPCLECPKEGDSVETVVEPPEVTTVDEITTEKVIESRPMEVIGNEMFTDPLIAR